MRPSEHRLGVLFEISIVCHVFVFVVLADGWGFVFWLVRRVFSGSGFFWFLASSCFLAVWSWGVGGRVGGGFLGFGVGCARFLCSARGLGASGASGSCVFVRGLGACAPGSCSLWGWGLGVFVRLVHSWDAVSGGGSDGPAPVFCAGVGCAWFPVSCSRCFWSCSRRGFRVFLFPLGASFLWFGGCRVGLGLFFLRLFCPVRVRVGSLLGVGPGSGSGVGFVWRV